jgi:hypothetical protein
METINKTYTSIGFIIENINEKNYQDNKMKIIFYDNEVDNDIIHNVDITINSIGVSAINSIGVSAINSIGVSTINSIGVSNNFINELLTFDVDFDISDYPLSLEFTGNYIKKLLKNISEFTEDFVIEYHKSGLFLLPLIKNSVETHYMFKNIEKLNLKYTGTEEIMNTSCKLGYLFPIGKEYISDIIKIYAHPFKNLIFEMENDIFNLKINIEIINLV